MSTVTSASAPLSASGSCLKANARPPFFLHRAELHPIGVSNPPPERIVHYFIEDRDHLVVSERQAYVGLPKARLDYLGTTLTREIIEKDRRFSNLRVIRWKTVIARPTRCTSITRRNLVISVANKSIDDAMRKARVAGNVILLQTYQAQIRTAEFHREHCEECETLHVRIVALRHLTYKVPELPLPQLIDMSLARAIVNGGIS